MGRQGTMNTFRPGKGMHTLGHTGGIHLGVHNLLGRDTYIESCTDRLAVCVGQIFFGSTGHNEIHVTLACAVTTDGLSIVSNHSGFKNVDNNSLFGKVQLLKS